MSDYENMSNYSNVANIVG